MTAWIYDVFVFIDSCGEKPNNLYYLVSGHLIFTAIEIEH